jgi:Flp pilus assembly pilin Flp
MIHSLHNLVVGDEGQDLVEYTLLLFFVMFTVLGLTGGIGGSVAGIVGTSNSQIAAGNTFAS